MMRFRRARGAEREQLRWVTLAAALARCCSLPSWPGSRSAPAGLPDPGIVGPAALVVLVLGISAATLRYRLYDLDRIISRTVTYAVLTVLLGGGYAPRGRGARPAHAQAVEQWSPRRPWRWRRCSSPSAAASKR